MGKIEGLVHSGSERGAWRRALERNKVGLGFGGRADFF